MVKMYSVVLRKAINVPEKDIKYVKKNGRYMMQGTYMAKGQERVATQFCKAPKK
jgi:hypothetical protein